MVLLIIEKSVKRETKTMGCLVTALVVATFSAITAIILGYSMFTTLLVYSLSGSAVVLGFVIMSVFSKNDGS
ncbi:hypothetical protein KC723_03365 [Candidatus Kaiserbacteria bacterium]|nr:hypothetical protein [Candidatus Kaiserbacteria bacterium]